jgi:hypothetical protein
MLCHFRYLTICVNIKLFTMAMSDWQVPLCGFSLTFVWTQPHKYAWMCILLFDEGSMVQFCLETAVHIYLEVISECVLWHNSIISQGSGRTVFYYIKPEVQGNNYYDLYLGVYQKKGKSWMEQVRSTHFSLLVLFFFCTTYQAFQSQTSWDSLELKPIRSWSQVIVPERG